MRLLLPLAVICGALGVHAFSAQHTTTRGTPRRARRPDVQLQLFNDKPVNLQSTGQTTSSPGYAGQVLGDAAYEAVSGIARAFVPESKNLDASVDASLRRMERDMELLDNVAGTAPQLGNLELAVLGATVVIAAGSPYVASMKLIEVLVPSMSALSAAIGISAEYTGRVAVSRGKEVAAIALQTAAEAEGLLAQAERAKAIVPLCVGIATTASAFALLAPYQAAGFAPVMADALPCVMRPPSAQVRLTESRSHPWQDVARRNRAKDWYARRRTQTLHAAIAPLVHRTAERGSVGSGGQRWVAVGSGGESRQRRDPRRAGVQVVTELFLVCPLFAVLAAAVAALATQDAIGLSNRAVGTGTRRFASSSNVGCASCGARQGRALQLRMLPALLS